MTENTPRRRLLAALAAGVLLGACAGTPEQASDRPDLGRGTVETSKAMGRAVKNGTQAVGSGFGTAFQGMRHGFQEPDAGDAFGPYPRNYAQLVKKHMIRVEHYPASTRFVLGRPARGYMNRGILRGGGVAWEGWLVDVRVETVQRLTGHRAARSYVVRIRDGKIVEVHRDDSLLHRL